MSAPALSKEPKKPKVIRFVEPNSISTFSITATPAGPLKTKQGPKVTDRTRYNGSSGAPAGPPPTTKKGPEVVCTSYEPSSTTSTVVQSSLKPITEEPPYTDHGTTIWRSIGGSHSSMHDAMLIVPELPTSNTTMRAPKGTSHPDSSQTCEMDPSATPSSFFREGVSDPELANAADVETCARPQTVTSTYSASSDPTSGPRSAITPAVLSHLVALPQHQPVLPGPDGVPDRVTNTTLAEPTKLSSAHLTPSLTTAATLLLISFLLFSTRRARKVLSTVGVVLGSVALHTAHAVAQITMEEPSASQTKYSWSSAYEGVPINEDGYGNFRRATVIVGAVIGGVVGVLLLGGCVYCSCIRKRKEWDPEEDFRTRESEWREVGHVTPYPGKMRTENDRLRNVIRYGRGDGTGGLVGMMKKL